MLRQTTYEMTLPFDVAPQRVGCRTDLGELVALRLKQPNEMRARQAAGQQSHAPSIGAICPPVVLPIGRATCGTAPAMPGDHSSVRGHPSASVLCSRSSAAPCPPTLAPNARSSDRLRAARPAPCRPPSSRARALCRCGHGASGFTWSGVTGDTPPQSLIPAAMSGASAPAFKFGGA